ncbi:MAG: carbohydrate ABC transporter permease [Anaerolineae bacterium]
MQAALQARPSVRSHWWRRRSVGTFFGKAVSYVLLVALALLFMVPFAFVLSSSLKDPQLVFRVPIQWIPNPLVLQNYPDALAQLPFWTYMKNTLILVAGVEAGRLLSASLTAYTFARLRFRWRGPLFLLVLSTMMIPYQVTLIPEFLGFRILGWLNSLKPLIVPSFFGGGAYYIFLLRQFFMTIPIDYDEAALIDGASPLRVFATIILPLSKPALGTVAIFTFMDSWSDLFGPLIYLNTAAKQTLAIGVAMWQRGSGSPQVHYFSHTMAIALLMALPPLMLFFLAQRGFIQGVVISGVKG